MYRYNCTVCNEKDSEFKIRRMLIYQGVHCCTNVCNLHLDDSPSKSRDNRMHWTEVTCLNERVFIKTINHLLTNCSQSTLLAMICRLSLLVLIQAKQCVKDYVMQSNESLGVLRLIFPSSRAGRWPVIGWKHLGGPWPLSDFYRELSSGCITDWKGSDTTWELRMDQMVPCNLFCV